MELLQLVMSASGQGLDLAGGSCGEPAVFGILTVSDRASQGVYDDVSGPAILGFFHEAIKSRYVWVSWEYATQVHYWRIMLPTAVQVDCRV